MGPFGWGVKGGFDESQMLRLHGGVGLRSGTWGGTLELAEKVAMCTWWGSGLGVDV